MTGAMLELLGEEERMLVHHVHQKAAVCRPAAARSDL